MFKSQYKSIKHRYSFSGGGCFIFLASVFFGKNCLPAKGHNSSCPNLPSLAPEHVALFLLKWVTCLDSGHLGSHCLIASLFITIKELHNMLILSVLIGICEVCWHKYLRTIHKTMPGQYYFQASWLDKPEFKGWLENVPGCRSSAHCLVCRKVFSMKNLGVSAFSVHGKGQTHFKGEWNCICHISNTINDLLGNRNVE